MRRKSISWEFFSGIAAMLLLGLLLMGGTQAALSVQYFAQEKRDMLTGILNSATMMTERFAADGADVTEVDTDAALRSNVQQGYELFRTSSDTIIFIANSAGRVFLSSCPDSMTGKALPTTALEEIATEGDTFTKGDLSGVLNDRYYVEGRALMLGADLGYIFAATPMDALNGYLQDFLGIFILSALLMVVVSSALSMLLASHITRPIEKISDAARQLGSGDFTARAPVCGCAELADFSTTFNNMAARLQTIDNSRGQFMGNIAHELRTPMTSIKGFIDGMLDGTIPEEDYKHYLGIVSQETGRLSRLVQNMLDITKLEAGEVKLHARPYDVWQTITDVVLADEQRIEDGKIDIQGLEPDGMPVFADPDYVHQVVYNIVDNAVKFTPPGGVITFKVEREGDMAVISIENTGDGISPEALPFVFERFYKEDRSRGRNAKGSGLGLHICKVLITLSGGQIRVESEQGQWCRFTFTLPVPTENKK